MIRINRLSGFSLLEIMVVIAIIAILASLAIPSQTGAAMQRRVVETLNLVEPYKGAIVTHYFFKGGKFPASNKEAGLPEPDKIISNYMEKMEVHEGVIHIYFGQKLPEKLHHKVLSLQPVYVKDSPKSPVDWICGLNKVPDGMTAAGTNITDLEIQYLPGRCR